MAHGVADNPVLSLLSADLRDHAVFTLDRAGRIRSWNAGAERVFGLTSEQAIGQHVSLFYDDRDIVVGVPVADLHAAWTTGLLEAERRFVVGGRRMTVRWVLRRGARDDADEIGALVHDLTRERSAADEHAELLAREQRARVAAETTSRAKDELISTLSHELRTPLTAVLGWARMLRTRQGDLAWIERAVEVIERNVKAQARIIDDLLDLSRVVTGNLQMECRRVDLVEVADAALAALRPTAEEKEIRVSRQVGAGPTVVWGDFERLRQVAWNLLSNAVKFTPTGGVVSVSVARVGAHAELEVRDTGDGLDPAFVPFLFERFRQADGSATRRHGGLGIGLAIVRHLVEMHGGTVSARSAGPQQGSTFVVRVPLTDGSVEREDEAPARSLGQTRVLVVEDDRDSLELLVTVLREAGAEVRGCGSVAEAIGAFPDFAPQVLVSDIGMPGEDGYALIRRIRRLSREQGGTVPAVALTGFVGARDRTRILSEGYQMHVPKPVEPAELVTVVASLAARGTP